MDLLLVNLALLGYRPADLTKLPAYCQAVSDATGYHPAKYPVVDATPSGRPQVCTRQPSRRRDARAIAPQSMPLFRRARRAGGAGAGNRRGPLSGKWNVIFWLEKRGLTASEELVDRILARGKRSRTTLTEEEIREEIAATPRA